MSFRFTILIWHTNKRKNEENDIKTDYDNYYNYVSNLNRIKEISKRVLFKSI